MRNNQEYEFVCRTCKVNEDLQTMIEHIEATGEWWIPANIRRSYGVGHIFTKDSIIYNFHFTDAGKDHDWGNVAEIEEKIRAFNEKLKLLEKTQ